MYTIEINKRIYQVVEIFHLFDIWQLEEQSSIYHTTTRILKIICQVAFVVFLSIGSLFSENWNESTLLMALAIAALVAGVKMTYFFWKQKEIRAFIQDVGIHSLADYEEFLKINWKISYLVKFSYSLFLMTCIASTLLTAFRLPVFSSVRQLPFNIWFPLDWKNNAFAYFITYAFVVICFIINNVAVLLNIIIWYLMLNCAIQYQILGSRFRDMFRERSTIKISEDEEILFLQELISAIKTHRKTKRTIDRFKSCFGNVFFVQITTSGIAICSSVYNLAFVTRDESYIQSMFNVVVLLFTFFDIFMVMYLGNEIKLSSDRLSYCLFECNWLEQSKLCKKNMIILSEVLQRPTELVIGKVYPLNMKTFTSIANAAYSMFNILKNMNH